MKTETEPAQTQQWKLTGIEKIADYPDDFPTFRITAEPISAEPSTKTELTQEEKRIKIAEVCGWHGNLKIVGGIPLGRPPGDDSQYTQVPDYFSDLNACHEMEKALPPEKRDVYFLEFIKLDELTRVGWDCAHATAAQRAEAFCKTMGVLTTTDTAADAATERAGDVIKIREARMKCGTFWPIRIQRGVIEVFVATAWDEAQANRMADQWRQGIRDKVILGLEK